MKILKMLGGVFVKNPRTTHETQPRQFSFGWASWFHIKEMVPEQSSRNR